jgi:hypothetical protein
VDIFSVYGAAELIIFYTGITTFLRLQAPAVFSTCQPIDNTEIIDGYVILLYSWID